MNILHMKYAIEIAQQGSINKASEVLLVAQPNLSRSVKELEADLGITIFERTSKGMILTHDGEEFIVYAKKILSQIEEVEGLYKKGHLNKQRFSLSVPRASYIAEAFSQFTNHFSNDPAEILYNETSTVGTINNVLLSDYKLGILRFALQHEKYMQVLFEENKLVHLPISTFEYVLLMSEENPLAKKDIVTAEDLKNQLEIAHADNYIPAVPISEMGKERPIERMKKCVFVFERAGQFDILQNNKESFMWVSPTPERILKNLHLVEKKVEGNRLIYKDVLIYKKQYSLSLLDELFIEELEKSRDLYIK